MMLKKSTSAELTGISDSAGETLKADPSFVALWNAAVESYNRTETILGLVRSDMERKYGLSDIGSPAVFSSAEVLELNGEILEVWGVGQKFEGEACDNLQDMWTANKNGGYRILFGKGAKLRRYDNLTALEYGKLCDRRKLAADGSIDCSDVQVIYPDFLPTSTNTEKTPATPFEDPAAVSVGYGKDYATIAAGYAAVDAAGVATIWPQNAAGDRIYREGSFVWDKSVTLVSDTVGVKNTMLQIGAYGFYIYSTANFSLSDMILSGKTGTSFATIEFAGTGTSAVNRVITLSSTYHAVAVTAGASVTCNNVLSMFTNQGAAFTCQGGAGSSLVCNYCEAVGGSIQQFNRSSGTMTCNNCLAYASVLGFNGTIGGANNASDDGTQPGANGVTVTLTTAKFAHKILTNGDALREQPAGYYVIDGQSSALENAGDATLCPAVTTDIDGRARSASTSNIGAVEGFTGFAASVAAAPGKATSVSAAAANAALDITFTTPANPSGGTPDRAGIAVSVTSAADAASKANAGTFAEVIVGLAALTEYTRRVDELADGTDLANGTTYYVVVAPGNSDDVFNTAAAGGDAVSAAPSLTAATTPTGGAAADAATSGELDITWTNGGSYASGDTMTVVNNATGAVLGGGDATTGSVRIGGLTNATLYTLKLRASSPGKANSAFSDTFTGTPTAPALATTAPWNVSYLNQKPDPGPWGYRSQIRLGGTEDWTKVLVGIPGGTVGTDVLAQVLNKRTGAVVVTLLDHVAVNFPAGAIANLSLAAMGAAPWTPTESLDGLLYVDLTGGTPDLPTGRVSHFYVEVPVTDYADPANVLVGDTTDGAAGTFDEALRNIDPGVANVLREADGGPASYKIKGVTKIPTLVMPDTTFELPVQATIQLHPEPHVTIEVVP